MNHGYVNPFGTDEMAAGYASSRPPVHPRVMRAGLPHNGSHRALSRALDMGCGAGVSTRALEGLARECVGLEPAEAMLHLAAKCRTVRGVSWRESPKPSRWRPLGRSDYGRGFAELCGSRPVLSRGGARAHGARRPGWSTISRRAGVSATTPALDDWFAAFFAALSPARANEARELSPEILSGAEFRISCERTGAFRNRTPPDARILSGLRADGDQRRGRPARGHGYAESAPGARIRWRRCGAAKRARCSSADISPVWRLTAPGMARSLRWSSADSRRGCCTPGSAVFPWPRRDRPERWRHLEIRHQVECPCIRRAAAR